MAKVTRTLKQKEPVRLKSSEPFGKYREKCVNFHTSREQT